jgi:4-carboxymuconolactone decarboxylase
MRLDPIAPADLTVEQFPLYELMKRGVSAKYSSFKTMREDGALLGPWSAWLHDPELGRAFWTVTDTMTRERRIPDAARQIAILVVGTRFGAAYEIYAHEAVAKTVHKMSPRRLATIASGGRPEDLDTEESVAFDLAHALVGGGVLPEPIYRYALEVFGQRGLNELVYLVGHYCFVSVTLNGFDIPIPEQQQT